MFRKGALLISVLALICTALFSFCIYMILDDITVLPFSVMFLQFFLVIVESIYDIFHKVNVKCCKYLIAGCISGLVSFTAFLAGLVSPNPSIYPKVIFPIALLGFILLVCIASKYYEEKDST